MTGPMNKQLCVCVCMRVHVRVCVYTSSHGCMWKPENRPHCHSLDISLFLRQVFYLEVPSRLVGQLASRSRDWLVCTCLCLSRPRYWLVYVCSAYLLLPRTRIINHCYAQLLLLLLMWVPENELGSSGLWDKHFTYRTISSASGSWQSETPRNSTPLGTDHP